MQQQKRRPGAAGAQIDLDAALGLNAPLGETWVQVR
jgi:hypothetical protein